MSLDNAELLEKLDTFNRRKEFKESSITHDQQIFTNLFKKVNAADVIIDETVIDTILDRFHGAYLNCAIVVVNKLRVILDLAKIKRKAKRQKIKNFALDLDDVEARYQKLRAATMNDRDRVIVDIMRYGGLRRGEVASLTIEAFKFYRDHVDVKFVHEKNDLPGEVSFIEPAATIEKYIRHRQISGGLNGDSAFLCQSRGGHPREGLSSAGIYEIIYRLCKKANVEFHPHLFRHYRATEYGAGGMGDAVMRNIFGWEPGSSMPSLYTNLSLQKSKEEQQRRAGLDVTTPEVEKPKTCGRCENVIPRGERYCPRCGLSADPAKAFNELQHDQAIKNVAQSKDIEALSSVIIAMQKQMLDLQAQIEQQKKK